MQRSQISAWTVLLFQLHFCMPFIYCYHCIFQHTKINGMAERAQFAAAFQREVVLLKTRNISILFAVFLFPLPGTPVMFYITERERIQSSGFCVLVFNHNFKKEKQLFESIFYQSLDISGDPIWIPAEPTSGLQLKAWKMLLCPHLNQTVNHNFATNLANLPLVWKNATLQINDKGSFQNSKHILKVFKRVNVGFSALRIIHVSFSHTILNKYVQRSAACSCSVLCITMTTRTSCSHLNPCEQFQPYQ